MEKFVLVEDNTVNPNYGSYIYRSGDWEAHVDTTDIALNVSFKNTAHKPDSFWSFSAHRDRTDPTRNTYWRCSRGPMFYCMAVPDDFEQIKAELDEFHNIAPDIEALLDSLA